MRKVLVIAVREYLAVVATKSFLVGILLMPILMGGGFVVQYFLRDQVDPRPKHYAIIDRTVSRAFYPLLEQAAEQRNQALTDGEGSKPTRPPFLLEDATPTAGADLAMLRLELSERVRKGELAGFLEIGPDILQPNANAESATVRYQTNRPSQQAFPRWAEATLNSAVQARRAGSKNINLADVNLIIQPVPLSSKGLTERDPRTGDIREPADQNPVVAFLLPGGLVILMFMLVMMGAAPLLQGVMEEKMQRVAEVLLGSVKPFQLMLGKLIGMAAVSMTLASIYLAGAYWAVHRYGYAEYLSLEVIAWFVVYLVLAVFMYGSLYAAVGAACTDPKEAQTMLLPVSLVTMMPLFVWLNVVQEPTSTFSTLASFFPPATPMLMVARLAVPPGIPWWQPALGVILVLGMTLLCVYAAGRIFRVGILMQGKGPSFAELARWVIRG